MRPKAWAVLKTNVVSLLVLGILAMQGTNAWAQHQDWCACGKSSTIPISFQIDHSQTLWQSEAVTAFARWNTYAQVFSPAIGDFFADHPNGVSEIFFADAAFMLAVFGFTLPPSTYGATFHNPPAAFLGTPTFNECPIPVGTTCGFFSEVDIVLNADFPLGWTNARPTLDGSGPATYKATALHEIGHALGFHHNFDSLSTMNYYEDFAMEYLALSDTLAARGFYSEQAQIVSDMAIYPFRHNGGFMSAGTTVASASPTTVRQGSPIQLSNFTIENVGSTTLSNVRYQLYLSSDQTITTSDYLLGTVSFATFSPGWWDSTGTMFTVPVSVPANIYYVGALVFYNTSASDSVTYNNTWVLDASRRVTVTNNNNPNTPNSPSPINGAGSVTVSTNLSWSGGDPDGDPVTYDVYLEAGDSSPDTLICNDISTTTCNPPGDLSSSTLYYWRVVATDDRVGITTGPNWSFTTLVNTGTILVDKVTDPPGSTQQFDFTLTGTNVNQAFSLTDASTPYNSGDLLPTSENGTYNVAETLPTDWNQTSVTCSDGSPATAVNLSPGETVTCTFNNTMLPPPSCGNGVIEQDEQCDDGNSVSHDGCSNICQIEDGWQCTTPPDVVLDPSFEAGTPNPFWTEASTNFGTPICDVVVCGLAGALHGDWWVWLGGIDAYEESSVSQAVTIPSTATELTFGLEIPVCDSPSDYFEVLIDGTQEVLIDGSSSLCEVDEYSTQSIDITAYADGEVHTLEFHSETFAVELGNTNFFIDAIEIPRPASECSIVDAATIIVDKVTNPPGSAQSFDFTLTGTNVNQAFSLTDASTPYNSGDLLPTSENGTYNVAETLPTDWTQTSVTCSDGSPATAVNLASGETVTCIFTNTLGPDMIFKDGFE